MSVMRKWEILFLGTVIAAMGMSLIGHANLGSVMLGVLWQGIAKQFGVSIGMASYITSALMVMFSFFYDRRQLKLGTLIHFLLFGLLMDVFDWILYTPVAIVSQSVFMAMGILFLSIGIGIYAYANLGRGPYEGMCFAIVDKRGIPLHKIRATLEILFTVMGILLGGTVGVATLLCILISGVVIQKTLEHLEKRLTVPKLKLH